MGPTRRTFVTSLAALPAACTIQPLPPLPAQAIDAPLSLPPMRPPQLGQTWTYRKTNVYNSQLLSVERDTIVALAPRIVVRRQAGDSAATLPEEQHERWGQLLRDPAWDFAQNFESPLPLWPPSLEVGATASGNTYYRLDGGSFRYWVSAQCVVKGWETVRLAQGEFATLRIERLIRLQHPDISRLDTLRRDTLWLAPGIGRWVARETWGEYRIAGRRGGVGREDYFRWELTDWQ